MGRGKEMQHDARSFGAGFWRHGLLAISSLLQEPGTCKRGRHAFAGPSIARAISQSRASHYPGRRAEPAINISTHSSRLCGRIRCA